MHHQYSRPVRPVADHERIPSSLARHAAALGLWDGVCHADPEPPTAQPPQQPATPATDEPLGDAGYNALKAERDRAAAAEKQMKALQRQLEGFKDIDPAKYREAMTALEKQAEYEQQQAQWRAEQEAKLKQQYEPQLKQQQDLVAQAQNELQQFRREVALKDEFLNCKGRPEAFKYARVDLEGRVRLNDAGALEVLDAEGNPAYIADGGKSRPMTVAELIDEMIKTDVAFAGNFLGNNSPGFQLGGDGRFNRMDAQFQNLSPKEQLDIMRSKGMA